MSLVKPTLALCMALVALPVQAQLYNKTIQTTYGPVMGYKYFNESTLRTYWNISNSNVAAFLGIPYAADTGYEVC
jgi:carboxylesterase 2